MPSAAGILKTEAHKVSPASSCRDRLVLGTATFQGNYGVTNNGSPFDPDRYRQLLEACVAQGIKKIDTAAAYGEAERILGEFGMSRFSVITKIQCEESRAGKDLEGKLVESLQRLKISRCYGLLLHNEQALAGPNAEKISEALHLLCRKGLVEKVGISSYEPLLARNLSRKHGFHLLQVPCNPMDRRVLESGLLGQWTGEGVEVHVRSIFLQGLLLRELPYLTRESSAMPLAMARLFREKCQAAGISPLHACLSFVWNADPEAQMVIGPSTAEELRQIAEYRPGQSLVELNWLPGWNSTFDPRTWDLSGAQ
jgi:aryl-alcohol dehydrogenase-like predicted oxidoreductase